MNTCPECSHPVTPDDAFCDNCGANLRASLTEPQEDIEAVSRDRINGVSPAVLLPRVQRFLAQQPQHITAWVILGNFHRDSQDMDAAVAAYTHALSLDPRFIEALLGLGGIHRRRKDYDHAMDCYRQALQIDPSLARIYSSMVVVDLACYRDQEALSHARQAYSLDATDPNIVANYASACHYSGLHAERDALYLECQQLNYDSLAILKKIFEGKLTVRDRR